LIYPLIWIKLAGGLLLIIVVFKDAQNARSKNKSSNVTVAE